MLNRVVCCYPDARRLLRNTPGAARSVYAFSAPVDRGLPGVLNKVLFRVSNVWYVIRSSKFRGFRVFVHDLTAVDAVIRAAGFTPTHRERRRIIWQIVVYARG